MKAVIASDISAPISGSRASAGDLFLVDTTGFGTLVLQITSAGTTCTITYEGSNDRTTWYPVVGYDTSNTGATAELTTSTTVGLRVFPVFCKFFRARISTYTSGTVSILGFMDANACPLIGINATIAAITAGANAIGDVGVQYRANATGAASVSKLIAAGTTNPTIVKAAAGRLLGVLIGNTSAAWRYVKMHNLAAAPTAGTTAVLFPIAIPPGGMAALTWEGGVAFSAGISLTTVTGAADADATAVTAGDLVGSLFFA